MRSKNELEKILNDSDDILLSLHDSGIIDYIITDNKIWLRIDVTCFLNCDIFDDTIDYLSGKGYLIDVIFRNIKIINYQFCCCDYNAEILDFSKTNDIYNIVTTSGTMIAFKAENVMWKPLKFIDSDYEFLDEDFI